LFNKKFFATCWVIVDAPSNLFEYSRLNMLFLKALTTPFASTPGCLKKFLSSADKKAFITLFGIASKGIKILFSEEKDSHLVYPSVYVQYGRDQK